MTNLDITTWTYGAEHELADWDRSVPLPPGFKVDERDVTIVNSNGIAADPKGKVYGFGGEINTPPTGSPEGQGEALEKILRKYPEATVNYRSNLHIHVRVPGLKGHLEGLKTLLMFNSLWLKEILPYVEPIPKPFKGMPDYKGAMRRYNRRKVSHHTLTPEKRIVQQLEATTIQEFFEAECPRSSKDGKVLWHFQPRSAINIRQLLETDTIEFRHFPGTINSIELVNCVRWCREYLMIALGIHPDYKEPIGLWLHKFRYRRFPKFPEYVHWMEERYRKTCHDGTLKKEEIINNIREILNEESTRDMPR